jgi:hypothetical protein
VPATEHQLPAPGRDATPAIAASVGHARGTVTPFLVMRARWLHSPRARPQLKIIVWIFIVLILASLGSALFFLVKDKGTSTRTAKALTWRVVFSITLFMLLMLAYYFGFIDSKL